MQPTVLGCVVMALTIAFAGNPLRLIQITLLSAIFEAASLAAVGGGAGIGIPLAMGPATALIAYIALQYALGMRYPGEARVFRALMPMLALAGFAVVSAFTLPDLFAGRVMIYPQKLEFFDMGAISLRPDGSNVNQVVYLVFDIILVVLAALYMTRSAVDHGAILRAYLLSGYVAIGIAVWQCGSRVAGLPFPSDILYSNPGWLVLTGQTLGGLPRINGSFSEPSALAAYLSGVAFCALWLCIRDHRVMAPRLLLSLSVLTIFMSTSTTGIVAVVVGLPLLLLRAVGQGGRLGVRRAGATLGGLLLGGFIVLVPLVILRPELMDVLNTIVQGTLEKDSSASFDERTAADAAALKAFADTYGLGVGWGMFRSSSLVPALVSNGGVLGLLLILMLGLRVTALARSALKGNGRHPSRAAVDGFSAALCGQLLAALIASPLIVAPAFYMQLACIVGAASRILVERRQTAPAQRPAAWGAMPQPGASR